MKIAIVTGASSGVGRETAILLSKMNAQVVLIARRENELEKTMSMLNKGAHYYKVADLSDFNGTIRTFKDIVTLDGKKLVFNTDYTVAYGNNTDAGTAMVTVTGKGRYTGSKTVSFTIVKEERKQTVSINCKKTLYKVAYGVKPFKINVASDGKMAFSSSNPRIAAVDKETGKVTVRNTGIATITIKAGEASKKVTVKVSPKKQSMKQAKAAKGRKLTVKWTKDKRASGYQVQISTDKKFKGNVKSKNLSKTSYTFTKLKTGRKYYARVRSYKKSGKETLYGAWSAAKSGGKVKK